MTDVSQLFADAVGRHQAGDVAAAERLYRQVIAARPDLAEAHNNLGAVLNSRGRPEAAIPCFERAAQLRQDYAQPHGNLGVIFQALGRLNEAEAAYRRAIGAQPGDSDAHFSLGNMLLGVGRYAEAAGSFDRAIAIRPNYPEALNNLGVTLRELGRSSEAIGLFQRVLAIKADHVEALQNLGVTSLSLGQYGVATAHLRRATALAPTQALVHADLIMALDLDPEVDPVAAAAERRRWAERHCAPLAMQNWSHANDRDPARPLRVGYVSADFCAHSAAHVFGAAILAHTPAIDVYCYSGVAKPDAITRRFREKAKVWRDVAWLDDAALAETIRQDRIDILVDLAGFTKGGRLLAFARKPAPIQMTAWGHPLGTGMRQMDYLFADPVFIPESERTRYVERIIDLPTAYPLVPLDEAPDMAPLPASRQARFAYGCFNNAIKLSAAALAAWAAILRRVPGAILVLKEKTMDDPKLREAMHARFAELGIGADRILLRGWTSRRDHLAAYAEIDLALDPFPNNGGVSSLDGLWMGVPMVTLMGDRPQSRAGASLLTTLDLRRLIATTIDDYVATAVSWAKRRDELAAIRMGLRQRMRASPICDDRAYCDAVEAAYRAMWRRWCGEVDRSS